MTHEHKSDLIETARLHEIFLSNDDSERAAKAELFAKKILKNNFIIGFAGHFSSGKSSMINALTGETSQARVDEMVAAVKKAEANVAAARVRAGDRLITAPFGGIVGTRRISAGALVSPGTVVTTLDAISTVNLDFAVPETFLASLRPGLDIEAEASAYANEVFNGKVVAVDSRIDPTTRSVTVRAEIDNEDLRLRPGMLMVVDLIKDRRESLMIPEAALQPEDNKQYVFLISAGNVADRVEVVIGRRRAGFVEILDGVSEGDLVIKEGQQDLPSGAQVEIVNRAEVHMNEPPAAQAVDMRLGRS